MTQVELASLPLVVHTIEIAGQKFEVRAATDQDALLRATAGREFLPFGLMLWESAIVLSAWAASAAASLAGLRIVELGAGVGLPGVVAAHFGAEVTALDIDPLALELATHNARANGVGARHGTCVASWHHPPTGAPVDLLIGADIAYDEADHAAVVRWIGGALAIDGVAWLTDPDRSTQSAFVEHLIAAGFTVESAQVATPDLSNPRRDVRVTQLCVRRAATKRVPRFLPAMSRFRLVEGRS